MQVVPLDPCNDEPFHMKEVDGELLIYSVGCNLLDDGGSSELKEEGIADIVFHLGATTTVPAKVD